MTLKKVLLLVAALIVAAFVLTACAGATGRTAPLVLLVPPGPAGPAGPLLLYCRARFDLYRMP